MNLKARLKSLERVRTQTCPQPFRVVVRAVCGKTNLEKSTCTRTLGVNGRITEVVHLDGGGDDMREEDLEKFISRFPITRAVDAR